MGVIEGGTTDKVVKGGSSVVDVQLLLDKPPNLIFTVQGFPTQVIESFPLHIRRLSPYRFHEIRIRAKSVSYFTNLSK